MKTFDQTLYDLYKENEITQDDTIHYADSANEMRLIIKLKDQEVDTGSALEGITLEETS